MELVYLWVEEYKNIKNQGFNFSPRFTCKYDEANKALTIDKNEDCLENFFGENINENIKDLALELQYNRHKDIVLELKDRYDLYNNASIQVLLKDTKIFKKKGEEYIKSLIMCSDTKDKNINKRPLSKLIKDISQELGLV